MTTHSIFPGYVPDGLFENDNIEFLREKIADVLSGEFHQYINFDRASIIRLGQRVLSERLETIPKMNQRIIMYATNEYRTHQAQLHKNMKLEEHYTVSQKLYDSTVERGPDLARIKLANRYGKARIGGTVRFVFF